MYERQHQESHASLPLCTASAQHQIDAVEPRMQYEGQVQELEEDWRRSLHSLQECICELLIQNQQLRITLQDSETNHKSAEPDQ